MKFSPGLAVPRIEDRGLLIGARKFADDIALPRQSYAAIVRSPRAHARILSIDTQAAFGGPGVLAVLTAEDWDNDGMGALFAPGHVMKVPPQTPDGTAFVNPDRKPLATGKVVYVGEAVALVVAETAAQAADAAELVAVDYDPLPAVADTGLASNEDAPLVRDDVPRNILVVHNVGDAERTEAAFSKAPRTLRQRIVINRVHANPMETRSVNACYDADKDHFTVWGGTHNAFVVRNMLAEKVFGTTPDKLDLVPGNLGGSFGLKSSVPVEMALMPWASKRLGRPVKWTATRSEMIIADNHARDLIADAEIAYDNDGQILAVRSHNINNLGAHVEYFGVAPSLTNVGGMVGPYTIPVAHVRITCVLSHTSPIGPYRGSGRPEASNIIERLIDLAAADLRLDPVEMRRRNLIPEDAFPYKTALTFTYDCGEFEKVMDKACAAADYSGFPERRKESESRGMLRGIGVAMSIESSAGPGKEFAALKFDPDGSVTVLAGSTNHGQGHETILVQYVAGQLGILPSDIRVVESDTRVVANGTGTGGSRSAAYNAAAISDVIGKCIDAGRPIAAHLLQTSKESVVFKNGEYLVAGGIQKIGFAEVARASFSDVISDGAGMHQQSEISIDAPAFPNSCQVSEVEIDPATGTVDLLALTVCEDVGYELNPLLVEGQLMGGIAQGVGQALMENVALDAGGQVLTGSFMDYAMPRSTDFCRFKLLSHPVPTSANPHGVKGVGEAGTGGALPAVMNAVNNALARAGVGSFDMPATPTRVWRALNSASP